MICRESEYFSILRNEGMCRLGEVFSPETLDRWNRILDAEFMLNGTGPKIEVRGERLHELGIFQEFFSSSMRRIIWTLMPDAILYDFHVLETIGGQSQPHVMAE